MAALDFIIFFSLLHCGQCNFTTVTGYLQGKNQQTILFTKIA